MTEIPNQKDTLPKKNLIGSLSGGVSKWFAMLTGKKVVNTTKPVEQKKEEQTTSPQPPQEDSVAEDIKKAKKFLETTFSKVSKSAAPSLQKSKEFENKGVEYAKKVVDVNFTKKAVRVFLVLIFGLLVLFVASRVFKLLGGEGNIANVPTPTTAPTVQPIIGTEPSIYAEDALILKIEEDAKVLLNEIVEKNLDDDSLSIPTVDEKINFLK